MTPSVRQSSGKIALAAFLALAVRSAGAAPTRATPETCVGVTDTGIFSDLDDQVQIALPSRLERERVEAVVDPGRQLLVLYVDSWPTKVYPLSGATALRVGDHALSLRPGDAAELRPLLATNNLRNLNDGEAPAPGDLDSDGIPDPLDVLLGARKTALNGASYGAGYLKLEFPGGDVPRDKGVCTDVIVRAVRNAGLDIQKELYDDIRRSPKSYRMVVRRNPNIDHRRVKTSLPYFLRRWDQRSAALDDPDDPLRPGDVVFMDTFPRKRGPDHVGIVSNLTAEDGTPLIINNWTYGSTTTHMELLSWVPVTHRFRFPSATARRRSGR